MKVAHLLPHELTLEALPQWLRTGALDDEPSAGKTKPGLTRKAYRDREFGSDRDSKPISTRDPDDDGIRSDGVGANIDGFGYIWLQGHFRDRLRQRVTKRLGLSEKETIQRLVNIMRRNQEFLEVLPPYTPVLLRDRNGMGAVVEMKGTKADPQWNFITIHDTYTKAWDKHTNKPLAVIREDGIDEAWSNKYKKSINCSNPKGFSQKAHCAARRKRARGGKTKSKPVSEAAASADKQLDVLLKVNPQIRDGNAIIVPGQIINLPDGSRYMIARNDNLWNISRGRYKGKILQDVRPKSTPVASGSDTADQEILKLKRDIAAAMAAADENLVLTKTAREKAADDLAVDIDRFTTNPMLLARLAGARRAAIDTRAGSYPERSSDDGTGSLAAADPMTPAQRRDYERMIAPWRDLEARARQASTKGDLGGPASGHDVDVSAVIPSAGRGVTVVPKDGKPENLPMPDQPAQLVSVPRSKRISDIIPTDAIADYMDKASRFILDPKYAREVLGISDQIDEGGPELTHAAQALEDYANEHISQEREAFGDFMYHAELLRQGHPDVHREDLAKLPADVAAEISDIVDQQAHKHSVMEAKRKRAKTLIDGMIKTLISKGRTHDEAVADLKKQIDARFYEALDAFAANEILEENLRDWFKQKWVRFGPDGKIRGACARGSSGEGKPKCLPQKKAHSLGKKGRASAARRKRREDPNPERHGKAKNVRTKESMLEDAQLSPALVRRLQALLNRDHEANLDVDGVLGPLTAASIAKFLPQAHKADAPDPSKTTAVQGNKLKESCPHCGGIMVSEDQLSEKKDACYYKVKSRYKVWPSAYASGALVQCRKKGAKNWGKSKAEEGLVLEREDQDKIADAAIQFYRDNTKLNPPDDYAAAARELIKAAEPGMRDKITHILKHAKGNPYLQGGFITTIGALLAGKVIGIAAQYGLSPYQTNLLLQSILNTVIPALVSRINGRDWKETIKYTLASAGVGTGIAALGGMNENKDDAVHDLMSDLGNKRKSLAKDTIDDRYKRINDIMQHIANANGITATQLHKAWIERYGELPDEWVLDENTARRKPVRQHIWPELAHLKAWQEKDIHRKLYYTKKMLDNRNPDYLNALQWLGTLRSYDPKDLKIAMHYGDIDGLIERNKRGIINRILELIRDYDYDDNDDRLRRLPVLINGLQHVGAHWPELDIISRSVTSYFNENFADGKGPGRPGDSQRHGIPKNATMAQLQKAAKAPGRKGQLARWQINMRRGRKASE